MRTRLSGRPLLDTRSDIELYVPRPTVTAELDRAVGLGLNVLLVGERGVGKTSLLRAWMYERRQTGPRVAYVPGSDAADAAALLRATLAAVDRLPDVPQRAELVAPHLNGYSNGALNGSASTEALLQQLRERLDGDHLVVIVDDAHPTAGHQLFGVLRDQLWAVDAQWIVAIDAASAPNLMRPPADAFFEVTVTVPRLTAPEAAELLRRRTGLLVPPTLDQLGDLTPRQVLDVAREVDLRAADPTEELIRGVDLRRQRDGVIAELGRPAAALAAVLDELGPTSPSDERLLDRLGWTRARASQVLKQLHDAGLVEYATARSDGPGRPARLYAMVAR